MLLQAEDVRERAPLRLTGRYVYVEFRPLSQKNVVFHLDTLTADKQRLRISFGTLYPSVRFLGSSLRVPLVLGTEGKWTVFAIDMNAALSLCSSPQPSLRAEDAPSDAPQHLLLLGVTMCSDMVVRGVYTSPAACVSVCWGNWWTVTGHDDVTLTRRPPLPLSPACAVHHTSLRTKVHTSNVARRDGFAVVAWQYVGRTIRLGLVPGGSARGHGRVWGDSA